MKKLNISKSLALWTKAEKIIPAGTQLFSKSPRAHTFGAYPIFIDRGAGCHVWDVDGNKYIDYNMGYGPNILGYAYPAVKRAVEKQLTKWTAFSQPCTPMIELSELLIKHIPCAEMVRLGKHGSDVTSMAIKCARSVTGRDKIAICGYHGWQDWSVAKSNLNAGIPRCYQELVIPYEYNNIKSLEKVFKENRGQIAGVTVELMKGEIRPTKEFLQTVNNLARKNGALVIYDEVVTGFRFGLGGGQKYFGVTPDLACFGKAMANGLPISALVGKRKYMKVFDFNQTFYSSTFGDDAISIAAAIATIKEIEGKPVVKHIWKMGEILQNGYSSLAKKHNLPTSTLGTPCCFILNYNVPENQKPILKSLVLQEGAKRGILYGLVLMVSYSHTLQDIKKTLKVTDEVFKVVRKALDSHHPEKFLEGKVSESVRL